MPDSLEHIQLYFEGKSVTQDDVKDAAHTVYLADLAEPEIHTFGSESALLDWANSRQDWQRIAHALGTEQVARHTEGRDLTREIRVYRSRHARLVQDLERLGKETGLEGLDLMRRATTHAPALEGPASRSAFLHAAPNDWLRFVWLPHYVPVPDFRMYGMNDRATVLSFVALPWGGSIYEHIWFQGRRLSFWGVCWGLPLQLIGWDGIASSGWSC